MVRRLKWTVRLLTLVAAAVTLGVGARQAYAGTAAAQRTCPPTQSIGECVSDVQCQNMCDLVYGSGQKLGDCSVSSEQNPGCCFCFDPGR